MSLTHLRGYCSDGRWSTNYRSATINARTYQDYESEVLLFLDWLAEHGQALSSVERLDLQLCVYLHELFANRGKGACSRVMSGVLHFWPEAKGHMPRSAQTVKGINKAHPAKGSPPLSKEAAVLIAFHQLIRRGLAVAVATLVCFDCLLRIQECLRLRYEDVIVPKDRRLSARNATVVLNLQRTKIGLQASVAVEDTAIQELLLLIKAATPAGERLFPFSYSTFRKSVEEAQVAWGFDCHFTAHSLRKGGATLHWLVHRDQPALKLRGRWMSDTSLSRYLQPAAMGLLRNKLERRYFRFATLLLSDLVRWFTEYASRRQ
jgi:integrase